MKNPSRFIKTVVAVAASLAFVVAFMPSVALATGDPITKAGNLELYTKLINAYPTLLPDTGSITPTELGTISGSLECLKGDTNLTSIEGLQYCSQVTEMNFTNDTNLTTLPSDMSGLQSLYQLQLYNCPKIGNSSVAAIATLPEFKTLDPNPAHAGYLSIYMTGITDLSALATANLAGLTQLQWGGNSNLTLAKPKSTGGNP